MELAELIGFDIPFRPEQRFLTTLCSVIVINAFKGVNHGSSCIPTRIIMMKVRYDP